MTRSGAAAWLLAHDHFCILTHRNPDGDTIGCAVGLCRGLRSLGKTAHILSNPQFGPRYAQWYDGLLCEEPPAPASRSGAIVLCAHTAPAADLPKESGLSAEPIEEVVKEVLHKA